MAERATGSSNVFQCNEIIEEGEVGLVTFNCTLPISPEEKSKDGRIRNLIFNCRGRSQNVLLNNEQAVNDDELEEYNEGVDPCFFDTGYTLAGRTGFQVWAGSRILIESLIWPLPSIGKAETQTETQTSSSSLLPSSSKYIDYKRLTEYQQRFHSNKETNIIELGAGIGVVGSCIAAIGDSNLNVLLTDLPTLVDNAILPNLINNATNGIDNEEGIYTINSNGSTITTAALDWEIPMIDQLTIEQRTNVDIIIASDCVWLVSMLQSLLDTVTSIFEASAAKSPVFIMSFQRRDAATNDSDNSSSMFTTVDGILAAMKQRNWVVKCLRREKVNVNQQINTVEDIFIFEVFVSTSFADKSS